MGCFLLCFGSAQSKSRKHRENNFPTEQSPVEQTSLLPPSPLKLNKGDDAFSLPPEPRKSEYLSFRKKRVTFDLSGNTYIDAPSNELINSFEAGRDQVRTGDIPEEEEDAFEHDDFNKKHGGRIAESFPSGHRYHDCANSDGEEEDDDNQTDYEDEVDSWEEDDSETEDHELIHQCDIEEPNSASFSAPLAISCWSPRPGIEVNSQPSAMVGARDRSQYLHSVLNPVENLHQWKAMKAKPALYGTQKENVNSKAEVLQKPVPVEPKKNCLSFTEGELLENSHRQEIRVDASLSSWLPSSPELKPAASTLSHCMLPMPDALKKFEDRPILGALTVEDIRRSASSSPKRSPCRSKDEIPIMGAVGCYWNDHTRAEASKTKPPVRIEF